MANDPVLIAYGAETSKTGRKFWRCVGMAYPHDQGSGLTLVLEVCPLDGKIVLLEPNEADDARLLKRAKEYSRTVKTKT